MERQLAGILFFLSKKGWRWMRQTNWASAQDQDRRLGRKHAKREPGAGAVHAPSHHAKPSGATHWNRLQVHARYAAPQCRRVPHGAPAHLLESNLVHYRGEAALRVSHPLRRGVPESQGWAHESDATYQVPKQASRERARIIAAKKVGAICQVDERRKNSEVKPEAPQNST